jgi:predicted RNase H-like HicB family nuclease
MNHYIALIRKDKNSDYGVEFPDLPGCVSAGKTMDEATAFAAEALALHIEGLVADGLDLPEPRLLDDIVKNRKYKGFKAAILVPAPAARVERVNVTFRQSFLKKLDRIAAQKGLTRSGLLAQAADKYMLGLDSAKTPKH